MTTGIAVLRPASYTASQVLYPGLRAVTANVPPGSATCIQQATPLWLSDPSCCWMHRLPGEGLMQVPPPPPGRPGQWLQWADGHVTWLPPPAVSF